MTALTTDGFLDIKELAMVEQEKSVFVLQTAVSFRATMNFKMTAIVFL
jgi:hypothetical protein